MIIRVLKIACLNLLVGLTSLQAQVVPQASSPSKTNDSLKLAIEKEASLKYFQKKYLLAVAADNSAKAKEEKELAILDFKAKLKFVILCFNLVPPYSDEISSLNKLAEEYEKQVSSVVIKSEDLNKYKELFTYNEFQSLSSFIISKTTYQKQATSFPVILILDRNGKIKHAWSGDKTDGGLKKGDFYTKIKAGLESISN